MDTKGFIYSREDDMFVDWSGDFPDYRAEGGTLEEPTGDLIDIYGEFIGGRIPHVHRVDELAAE